jgi:F420-0:gamma-glutamyl ligase-like protein
LKIRLVKTRYWRPGEDGIESIIGNTRKFLRDGDVLVLSEKAISIAKGNIVDESRVRAGPLAKILVRLFTRIFWGYFLGRLCHFRSETLRRLRHYPLGEGSAHKQTVLHYAGLIQALKYGSEGGIDVSNLPLSYACLPLDNPQREAEAVRKAIKERTGKNTTIMISDTDSTFSYHGFHFTSRPDPIEGIHSFGGALSFIIGRALRLKQRATPLAMAGSAMSVEMALKIAEVAHHARGSGAGRTVWDMRQKFGVGLTEVTWEMLEAVDHFPIVVLRKS